MPDFFVHSNTQEFLKTFDSYLDWNKRAVSDIVNQKLYFVALQAMNFTKKADAAQIKSELMAPSKKYPEKSLGELLVLMQMRRKGKMPKRTKTLNKNMSKYVQRLINARVNHIQFLRSGWLPAVKKLDYWNRKTDTNSISFSRRFAPKKPQGIKQFGRDKGDVKPAILGAWGPNCRGTIMNYAASEGKQVDDTAAPILRAGLKLAVDAEMRSMRNYIERKVREEVQRRASRGEMRLNS